VIDALVGKAELSPVTAQSIKAGRKANAAMSEAEWSICSDPWKMADFLLGDIGERKLQLFGVGCCRRVMDLLSDGSIRRAIEVVEQYADRLATNTELQLAISSIREDDPNWSNQERFANQEVNRAVLHVAGVPTFSVSDTSLAIWNAVSFHFGSYTKTNMDTERDAHASLLRDIVGNPFRPITLDPAWLTSKVKSLAQTIYDNRAFERMPELADALEKAGCDNVDILGHCHQPGEHVRGCWVADLLLGKD
jgi:hypothetical protein